MRIVLIELFYCQVAANYDTLLGQVRGIRELEIVLSTVQTNIIELKRSLAR